MSTLPAVATAPASPLVRPATPTSVPTMTLRAFLEETATTIRQGMPSKLWLEATVLGVKAGPYGHQVELVDTDAKSSRFPPQLRAFLSTADRRTISAAFGIDVDPTSLVDMTANAAGSTRLPPEIPPAGAHRRSVPSPPAEPAHQGDRTDSAPPQARRPLRPATRTDAGARHHPDRHDPPGRGRGMGRHLRRSHGLAEGRDPRGHVDPSGIRGASRSRRPHRGARDRQGAAGLQCPRCHRHRARRGRPSRPPGGSTTEKVARAICACPVPVFTGLGHAINVSLLDEVAHQALDTPSRF